MPLALSARLAAGAGTEPVLLSQDGRFLTHTELQHSSLRGPALPARVAVLIADPVLLIRTLVALDGQVAELLLLSHTLPDGSLVDLVQAAGCQAVLTDRANALCEHPSFAGITVLDAETALCNAPPPCPMHNSLWLMATSGTTGQPKIISHQLNGLATCVRPVVGEAPVWGLLSDTARMAGLLVVLQALIGGGRLVLADTTTALAQQITTFVRARVTHISCTPTLWRRILMLPDHAALRLNQVTLGGESSDAATLTALTHAWPSARISHIYASTEAGQGFSVADGLPGFPAQWLDQAPGGLGLAIREGVLWLRPPGGHDGSGTGVQMDDQGFIRTGDLVQVQGDRVLFLGRESGLINVAGIKVWPETVEAVIKSVPGVGLVQVSARKNPLTGALVVADIQPMPGQDEALLKSAIQAACRTALPREAVPASLRFVAELASNAAGKLQRTRAE